MCERCVRRWMAWSDYPCPPIRPAEAGRFHRYRYDTNVRAAIDDWRNTIRRQQLLIRDNCQRQHTTA